MTTNRYLGTDKQGNEYYREVKGGLDYVYQYTPDQEPNGWMCSFAAWQRSLHQIITIQPININAE